MKKLLLLKGTLAINVIEFDMWHFNLSYLVWIFFLKEYMFLMGQQNATCYEASQFCVTVRKCWLEGLLTPLPYWPPKRHLEVFNYDETSQILS